MDSENDTVMMQMTFYNDYRVTILFDQWNVVSMGSYVGACFATFIVAFLWESARSLRPKFDRYLLQSINNKASRINEYTQFDNVLPRRSAFRVQLARAFFHMIQFSLAYLLMLVVMTYNMGLFLAVVLGSTVGFFAFNKIGSEAADCSDCH